VRHSVEDPYVTREIRLPELGENIESGVVAKVLVSVGDRVEVDQPVLELETDKAVVEVPSSVAGVVREIPLSEGDEVRVGQVLLVVEAGDGGRHGGRVQVQKKEKEEVGKEAPGEETEPGGKKEQEPQRETGKESAAGEERESVIEIRLPELGENIEAGTVSRVLVGAGDRVEKDQGLVELETDKAAVEIPCEAAGVVVEVFVEEGREIRVGDRILSIRTAGERTETAGRAGEESEAAGKEVPSDEGAARRKEPERAAPRERPGPGAPAPSSGKEPARGKIVAAAPSVRRFAREIGVDVHEVSGTGPGGRISIEDVKAHSKELHRRGREAGPAGMPAEPLPDFSRWGEIERRPMTQVRQATARHLGRAWATVAHVTHFDRAELTEVEELRREHAGKVEEEGGKLTVTAILIKIAAAALKVFPAVNASLDLEAREIVYKRYVHIGVAVDTEHGLLVPVIRDVDQKNIIELSVELTRLAERARSRRLGLEDLQGGTFTVSNLGGIGGSAFTPIVHHPQAAILGVSRSAWEPVYADGRFEPRRVLPLALSYDHRLIDGADAARFLRWICEAVEEPFKIVLEG
jgi:pyruvate dehydrogenase E2 component (dihydrolipoamide acetyltransferase)